MSVSEREQVLLVEDEAYVRESTAEVLREEGIAVHAVASVAEARALAGRQAFGAVVTDLRMPGEDGRALLGDAAFEGVPVIVITGHGTIEDAVGAMKAGAFDFVQKPIDPERLLLVVRRALEHGRLVDEVRVLRTAVDRLQGERALVGGSSAMASMRRLIEQVAPTDATVLLTGESGTGKELVASEIHRLSRRGDGPLVQVNCAAVPETLFESEFFGHRRGAFSGATEHREGRFVEARGGTLVLDEVETLQPEVQAKLLRVLESGEFQRVGESRTSRVDVRVIAVSNADLQARVRDDRFRSDLFWRLNVFPIEMPPLRAHLEDMPEIVAELLARIRAKSGVSLDGPPALEPEALRVLEGYGWPGNVRELRNVLERALILSAPAARIGPELVHTILSASALVGPASSAGAAGSSQERSLNLRSRLEVLERELIERALNASGGQRKGAAERLGIDPKNMGYYLRKHGIGDEAGA